LLYKTSLQVATPRHSS